MFIRLSKEHKALIDNKDTKVEEVELKPEHDKVKKPNSKLGIYETKRDQYVCESYKKGIANKIIIKEAKISNGLMYTILRKYSIKPKGDKSIVHDRVKHVLDNTDKLKEFLNDYELLSHDMLCWKYKLHKNGVYYILDLLDVPRKRQRK